jgi:myosin V
MILQQLRCCGVLEVVRIAKAGYPTRYEHKKFVKRYSELMPKNSLGGNAVQQCELLLAHFRVPELVWQLGHTKIFFKAGVLGAMEDLWRRTRSAVLIIQASVRMHMARSRFLALRQASTTISKHYRGATQRSAYAVQIRQHRAAVKIQAGTRGLLARLEAARRLAAITTIQVACKRWHLDRRCKRREADMRQALEFAQNRALRAQDKLHALESQLEEWAAIKEEFSMTAPEIRGVLKAWRGGGQPEPSAESRALPAAALSEQDARDLKLLQQNRQAFFAWQMGAGLDGVPRSAEESELQVCSG